MKNFLMALSLALSMFAGAAQAQTPPDLILTAPRPLTLQWNNNATNETGTEIERAVDGGSFTSVFILVGADLVTWTDNNIIQDPKLDKRYCWRVRDFSADASGQRLYSGFTNAACAVVKKPLQAPDADPSNLVISFENASGEIRIVGRGFRVESFAREMPR